MPKCAADWRIFGWPASFAAAGTRDQATYRIGGVPVTPMVGADGVPELRGLDAVESEPGESDEPVVRQRHGKVVLRARHLLRTFNGRLEQIRRTSQVTAVER